MSTQSAADIEIGQRIRALRGERSQSEFAELLGISRSALANYETGRTSPKPSLLEEIARRCGVDFETLRTGHKSASFVMVERMQQRSATAFIVTPDELSFIRLLRHCPAETILNVAQTIKENTQYELPERSPSNPWYISADIEVITRVIDDIDSYEKGLPKDTWIDIITGKPTR